MYREEAVKALLESLTCEENSAKQALSAFILSNIGGTYSWTGEPYTVAWLAKRAGLTSLHHKNIIKNYDFSDESLQVSCHHSVNLDKIYKLQSSESITHEQL